MSETTDPSSWITETADAASRDMIDVAGQMIRGRDVTGLPQWAQQVCTLVLAIAPERSTMSAVDVLTQLQVATYLQHAKSFTADKRDALVKKGQAMGGGGFPIENKGDLANAIKAFGRAANKAAAKAHIVKRAKALGATDMLPDGWK